MHFLTVYTLLLQLFFYTRTTVKRQICGNYSITNANLFSARAILLSPDLRAHLEPITNKIANMIKFYW